MARGVSVMPCFLKNFRKSVTNLARSTLHIFPVFLVRVFDLVLDLDRDRDFVFDLVLERERRTRHVLELRFHAHETGARPHRDTERRLQHGVLRGIVNFIIRFRFFGARHP